MLRSNLGKENTAPTHNKYGTKKKTSYYKIVEFPQL